MVVLLEPFFFYSSDGEEPFPFDKYVNVMLLKVPELVPDSRLDSSGMTSEIYECM